MNHNIDELLDRYWDGESSVDEENALKAYFASDHVLKEHLPYSDLFRYFEDQSKIKYSNDIKAPHIEDDKHNIVNISFRKYVYAIAAVFILGLCSIFVMKNISANQKQDNISLVQEIEDPEEALRVTKQALALVSRKFNKSKHTVKENLAELEKASIFK
ncbi:MAG: hypothetical protein IPO92_12650 [Saprospiraceae bacterium]|nr:hypothetical protein [Saprospiraceae bacterium]